MLLFLTISFHYCHPEPNAVVEAEQLLCLSSGLHIYEVLVPENAGRDTNIVLLGYLELKLCGKT